MLLKLHTICKKINLFASDFTSIKGLSKKFSKGTPFKPLEQLMGVFPAASRNHVPIPFAKLMIDPVSFFNLWFIKCC